MAGDHDLMHPRRSIPIPQSFFGHNVRVVARDLIGATLLVDGVGGMIVETEAYHHTEPAAHSFRGQTPRNAVMFGPPGFAYALMSFVNPRGPPARF
jgi:DNA-3-methyladenine glycosylase